MAYGKNKRTLCGGSIPAGMTTLDLSVFPVGKLRNELIIRRKFLAAANAFVDAVFNPVPLASARTNEEVDAILTAVQKTMGQDFNKAYVEKVRLSIPTAIAQGRPVLA